MHLRVWLDDRPVNDSRAVIDGGIHQA